jgi:hypothetical protein
MTPVSDCLPGGDVAEGQKPEDLDAWPDARKLEAVRLYGADRNWSAVEKVFGRPAARRVKVWAELVEAGVLGPPPELDPLGPDVEPGEAEVDQDQEEQEPPAWAENLRQALTLANWSGVAAIVEPRFREGLERLARSRTSRDFLAETQAIRTMVETVRRLKEETPLEVDRGHATDAAIARLLEEQEEKWQWAQEAQDPERMAERLRGLGWTVLEPGPRLEAQLSDGAAAAHQRLQEPLEPAPEGQGMRKAASEAPGAPERPKVKDAGPVRRRGPRGPRFSTAPDDGLSEEDRKRLEALGRFERAQRLAGGPGGWPA